MLCFHLAKYLGKAGNCEFCSEKSSFLWERNKEDVGELRESDLKGYIYIYDYHIYTYIYIIYCIMYHSYK